MKFQTIIIGAGLSGLVAGIKLAKAGRKVAIVSTGQSALHFSSGSFDLLSSIDGKPVENPLAEIASLPAEHPYSKIGTNIKQLIDEVKPMMAEAGIVMNGSAEKNHYRLTPLGKIKPGWLTVEDFATFSQSDRLPWKKVTLVNINGFLDFQTSFLALGLNNAGTETTIETISTPLLENLRKSTTEMRAPNIARILNEEALNQIATEINRVSNDSEAVFMPAVVGVDHALKVASLRNKVSKPLYFISTMPTSVPGVRMQQLLREYFKHSGGTYFLGDKVTHGDFEGERLTKIYTTNFTDDALEADEFILASGSFFSHGLIAQPNQIIEPTFGLDVIADDNRPAWFDKNIYADQPFMAYGVNTNATFHVMKDGREISNLYASGSVLAGCNPLKSGCGAGIAILTALHIASSILNK